MSGYLEYLYVAMLLSSRRTLATIFAVLSVHRLSISFIQEDRSKSEYNEQIYNENKNCTHNTRPEQQQQCPLWTTHGSWCIYLNHLSRPIRLLLLRHSRSKRIHSYTIYTQSVFGLSVLLTVAQLFNYYSIYFWLCFAFAAFLILRLSLLLNRSFDCSPLFSYLSFCLLLLLFINKRFW